MAESWKQSADSKWSERVSFGREPGQLYSHLYKYSWTPTWLPSNFFCQIDPQLGYDWTFKLYANIYYWFDRFSYTVLSYIVPNMCSFVYSLRLLRNLLDYEREYQERTQRRYSIYDLCLATHFPKNFFVVILCQ